jgi:hypothetical protein
MSTRELRRAEVLGRVKSKTLRLSDAAKALAGKWTAPPLLSSGKTTK